MRLSNQHRNLIKEQVRAIAGEQAQVKLFGSRLDDEAKGGDIDLLVSTQEPVKQPASLAAQLSAVIMRRLHGRKVDVLLDAPNLKQLPIHAVAKEQGQWL